MHHAREGEPDDMTRRYAQLDLGTLADRKFRHLARLLEDRDWYAAVGVYTEAVLDSWAEGDRVPAQGPDDLVSALVDVKLLDPDHRIPESTWAKRFTAAVKRQNDRDRQRRRRQSVTTVTGRDKRDTTGQSVIPSNLISSSERNVANVPHADQGGGPGDQAPVDPGALPPGLAADTLPVLSWLSANVAYVDPLSGLGRMVGEKVANLGADTVLTRLQQLHARGHLDRGDAFGYVVQVTDAYRQRAKPDDDSADIDAALKRRRSRQENPA